MKKCFFTLSLVVTIISTLGAQSYVNPESIVYDTANARYLISNKGGNTIVQLDSEGVLTNFVTSKLNEPKGLLIVGDTLISVNSTSVQGFSLTDATRVLNISIAGSVFMNDATSDGKGNLYISDSDKDVVYKLSLKTGVYSTLISSGINPNGLLYDNSADAILICSWGSNAEIQSFSLIDSSLTSLVTTKFSNLDGLARDNCGNIYVSSWGSNSVYVFDSMFQNPPTKVSTNHNGPADISINQNEQVLAIPNFGANSISLINLGMQCKAEIGYVSPLNKSANLNDSLKIDWEDVSEVSGYKLEYSKDSTFQSSVFTIKTIGSDTIISGLNLNTKYFWRVRTLGGDYKSIFNNYWSFTTKEEINVTIDNPIDIDYKIYPNPVQSKIYVNNSNDLTKIEYYFLFNSSGLIVKQGKLISNSIDVSDLNKGLYMLNLKTKNNSITEKIIIE